MSTNAAIGYKDGDQYIFSYCHWDGYPEYTGKTLCEHYQDRKLVKNMVDLGDKSVLDKISHEVPSNHSFDNRVDGYTVFYGRDRGESNVEPTPFPVTNKIVQDVVNHYSSVEWVYLFENGEWKCFDAYSNEEFNLKTLQ